MLRIATDNISISLFILVVRVPINKHGVDLSHYYKKLSMVY